MMKIKGVQNIHGKMVTLVFLAISETQMIKIKQHIVSIFFFFVAKLSMVETPSKSPKRIEGKKNFGFFSRGKNFIFLRATKKKKKKIWKEMKILELEDEVEFLVGDSVFGVTKAPLFLRHDEEEEEEEEDNVRYQGPTWDEIFDNNNNFERDILECSLCAETQVKGMRKCEHEFCLLCFSKLLEQRPFVLIPDPLFQNDTTHQLAVIACPFPGCKEHFCGSDVHNIFGGYGETHRKYLTRVYDFYQTQEFASQLTHACERISHCPECKGTALTPSSNSKVFGKATGRCLNRKRKTCCDHELFCLYCGKSCLEVDYCASCVEQHESEMPEMINRFLLVKNKDLSLSMVQDHAKSILDAKDYISCTCSVCQTSLEKTSECNALEHCGSEICYVCGRRALPNEKLENSHWSRCPRFFEIDMLKHELGYQCVDSVCFDDGKKCSWKSHQKGIKNLFEYRKQRHAGAFFESLPLTLKSQMKNNFFK
jgi:hypothetical protein